MWNKLNDYPYSIKGMYPFKRTTPYKKHPEGFTLIEILLVAVILVIIAGLSLPNFNRTYLQFQLRDTADTLAYTMRYAQGKAIAQNLAYRLEFNSECSKYWLTKKDAGSENAFNKIPGRFGRIKNIPPEINIDLSEKKINFTPDGHIDKVRIYVCQEEECLTVSSREQSGYVQIFDYKL